MPFAVDLDFRIRWVEKNLWELLKSLVYVSDLIDGFIEVPAGFICDGSSIPRVVWWLIGHPLEGPFGVAGFIHDYLYRFKILSRKKSDLLYKEGLIDLGCSKWKAEVSCRTLRLFGWWAWRKKK